LLFPSYTIVDAKNTSGYISDNLCATGRKVSKQMENPAYAGANLLSTTWDSKPENYGFGMGNGWVGMDLASGCPNV
jgi:hypothetical protein